MTDLQRLYALISNATGIARSIHPDLEREAAERAYEARQEVGLSGSQGISHPTQMERESRLGPQWAGKGVAEIASWNYQWSDPIQALVDDEMADGTPVGFLNTEPHNTICRDPSFRFWGVGLYTELPPGEPELNRRYYCVIWLAKGVPVTDSFTDVPASHPFYNDIEFLKSRKIVAGVPNDDGSFRYEPDRNVTRGEMAAFLARILRAEDRRDPS